MAKITTFISAFLTLAAVHSGIGVKISFKNEILMDFDMVFTSDYKHKDNHTVQTYSMIATSKPSADIQADKEILNTTVSNVYTDDQLQFTFYYNSTKFLKMDLMYTFDVSSHLKTEDFSDDSSNSTVIHMVAKNIDLMVKEGSKQSYFCQLPQTITFTKAESDTEDELTLTAKLSRARIQAFGIDKAEFGEGVECPFDWTDKIQGNYTISTSKYTCVNLTLSLSLSIPYTAVMADKKTETRIAHIYLPEGRLLNPHDCAETEQVVWMTFYDNDLFTVNITMNRTEAKNYEVYIQNITMQYKLDEVLFPHSLNASGTTSDVLSYSSKDHIFSFEEGEFFKCLSNETYHLTSQHQNATLYMSNLRYVAFNEKENGANLDGKAFEQCPDDVTISNVVPIAVGAALGVLVLIVLIAYLIGRRKTHKGYESV